MSKSESSKTAMIIGAGFTGLSCAVKLADSGYTVFLIDKAASPGGLGSTHTLSNGKQCEAFYHHFFTHDKCLVENCKRFLGATPAFANGTMAIYYNKKHYNWNGFRDLLAYPHISFVGKIRFAFATLALSFGLLPDAFLDKSSLSEGMRRLFGKDAYYSVWKPMLAGKFGSKLDSMPLRWMQGRLRQRLNSRNSGIERLGYQPGSLRPLITALTTYITQARFSEVLCKTSVESIDMDLLTREFNVTISDEQTSSRRKLIVDKIIFTVPTKAANATLSTAGRSLNTVRYPSHEYFKAICVIIEMNESLSNSYWTNIADETLFFCGYIEQTRLTGVREYGGLHIAYLTKYLSIEDSSYDLDKKSLHDRAAICLSRLFPEHNLEKIIIRMDIMIAKNAQVVTGFGYVPPLMDVFESQGIFLGNMSHVYPDERSINNALRIGEDLAGKSL